MALTIVDTARPVTGGVDTHLDLNVAAALDGIGGLLGVEEFPTTPAGNRQLLGWLSGFNCDAARRARRRHPGHGAATRRNGALRESRSTGVPSGWPSSLSSS